MTHDTPFLVRLLLVSLSLAAFLALLLLAQGLGEAVGGGLREWMIVR